MATEQSSEAPYLQLQILYIRFSSIRYSRQKGYKKTVVWVKSARIEYKKPGDGNLYISIRISQEDISDALRSIQNEGKIVKIFTIEIYDKHRNLCAVSNNEIYIRNLLHESQQTPSPKEINTSEININSIN